jgi:hypothetical protein
MIAASSGLGPRYWKQILGLTFSAVGAPYHGCHSQFWLASNLVMFSHKVWAIEELVRMICSHTLEYDFLPAVHDGQGHDGIALDSESRETLARCILVLNRFIFCIAVEVLWRDVGSLRPLYALLPRSYYAEEGEETKEWEDVSFL